MMCDVCGKSVEQIEGDLREFKPRGGNVKEVDGYRKPETWHVCPVCDPNDEDIL